MTETVTAIPWYIARPEGTGGPGAGTLWDRSTNPPTVVRLVHVLRTWLGDDLVSAYPCHLVTDRLARVLAESRLTGFELDHVTVLLSEDFPDNLSPELLGAALPQFRWLKLTGTPNKDDLWPAGDGAIGMSEAAYTLLQVSVRLSHCEVRPLVR